jgi:hypothetical protein
MDLFWLMISVFSPCHLALVSLGCDKAQHGRGHVVEQAAHLVVTRKPRKGSGKKAPSPKPTKLCVHQWINPSMRSEHPQSNHPEKAPPLNTAALGTKPIIQELWGGHSRSKPRYSPISVYYHPATDEAVLVLPSACELNYQETQALYVS